jgi:hypothetical protein
MLQKTNYTVDLDMIKSVQNNVFSLGKYIITEPAGNFFYDPWKIKEEYKNTPWENIMCQLDVSWGEARLIVMDSPSCYTQHADIDDRYHLNISGDVDFLVDTESKIMYSLTTDGVWYEMDAGILHSAVTIGEHKRSQLVVRKLLTKNYIEDSIRVVINIKGSNPRYKFDNALSQWLNRANKKGIINNFTHNSVNVEFDIDVNYKRELINIIPKEFTYEFK